MSHALYRLGRLAARHPWMVIGTWLTVAILVIGASIGFGKELEDTFAVPGLDSQEAIELLSSAESDRAGLTARIVVAARDGETFFTSPDAQSELSEIHAGASELPNVLFASDPASVMAQSPEAAVQTGGVSPDGRIAIVRLQYPIIEDLDVTDLERLVEFRDEVQEESVLQVEAGGELFNSFQAVSYTHLTLPTTPYV